MFLFVSRSQVTNWDPSLTVPLETLAKLNVLNKGEGSACEEKYGCLKVPYHTFYVAELSESVDIRVDYVKWVLDDPKVNVLRVLYFNRRRGRGIDFVIPIAFEYVYYFGNLLCEGRFRPSCRGFLWYTYLRRRAFVYMYIFILFYFIFRISIIFVITRSYLMRKRKPHFCKRISRCR